MLKCYNFWRDNSIRARNSTIDQCVWNNPLIPPIGSKLCNYYLMNNDINYLSDFTNDDYSLLSYTDFIIKWDISVDNLPRYEYKNILSAINSFNIPNRQGRDISTVERKTNLTFFKISSHKPSVKGGTIRDHMKAGSPPSELLPMIAWDRELHYMDTDWRHIFCNIYKICRNQKLIQFQYKLLMRISTSRYMRHKMGIVSDYNCKLCSLS